MRTLRCVLLLAALALVALADTNATGSWSGSFSLTGPNGETKDDTAYLVLKQDGATITGTIGPNEEQQFPIGKGKIQGDKISIEVDHDGRLVKLELILAADRITGDASLSNDGQNMKAKIDVKRVK